ncbi:hypothetical protein FQR65_LT08410 [Abscondita terminalis]|nr:hypothetical protein FQR65_LT08410 [Abscondita terminalis]
MWLNKFFLILILQSKAFGYIEYVTINGCESCALRLTCRHLDSIITIVESNFKTNSKRNDTLPTALPLFNPRIALTQRCSGINHCSFILTKDCPGAEKWGLGTLSVKYACISGNQLTKYCNAKILLPEPETLGISQGFIHNPGYPRFYLGQKKCLWSIRAPPLQRIKITIFDISLVGNPNVKRCSDLLEISDRGQILYSTCIQQEPPVEIVSLDDSLDIVLMPSKTESVLPTRGVLLYYTAVGCPTPNPPRDGYLVYRNDTIAEYSCCVGYTFPDINKRNRIIKCMGYQWNASLPLPDCTLNYVKSRPHLVSGKQTNQWTQKALTAEWEEVSQTLNSTPGASKDWKGWRKTWHDMRSRTKLKEGNNRRYARGTGGGPPKVEPLTDVEEDILTIIKTVSIEGHAVEEAEAIEIDIQSEQLVAALTSDVRIEVEEEINDQPSVVENKVSVVSENHTTPQKCKSRKSAPKKLENLITTTTAATEFKDYLKEKMELKRWYYDEQLKFLATNIDLQKKQIEILQTIADNISK